MSLDKSLKSHGALARHRNVLTRGERLVVLAEEGRLKDAGNVFGLPKVGHRKAVSKKVAKAAAAEGAEGAAPAAGAAAAKPAAGAKAPAAKAPAGKK
jgi:small basic protein (TIGR04137 family)